MRLPVATFAVNIHSVRVYSSFTDIQPITYAKCLHIALILIQYKKKVIVTHSEECCQRYRRTRLILKAEFMISGPSPSPCTTQLDAAQDGCKALPSAPLSGVPLHLYCLVDPFLGSGIVTSKRKEHLIIILKMQ